MNDDDELEYMQAIVTMIAYGGNQLRFGVLAEAMYDMLTEDNRQIFLRELQECPSEH